MRVLITGVGDAFTRRHFGSSALIDAPGGWVMIDCPDLIHRAVDQAAARAGWCVSALDVRDFILTHLHGDHSNGLESIGFAHFILRQHGHENPRPRLHTNEHAATRVWEKLAPAMDGSWVNSPRSLDDFFELHTLSPERAAHIAGLTVRCRFTKHPVPTTGLLISDGGHTLGWSSDTPYDAAHLDWFDEADVIVHECNLGAAHTPIERLNELPQRTRAKLRLIHLPDDFDATSTDIVILREGEVLEW